MNPLWGHLDYEAYDAGAPQAAQFGLPEVTFEELGWELNDD